MNRKLGLGRVSPDRDGFSEGRRRGWCDQGPLCSPGLRLQVWEGLTGTGSGGVGVWALGTTASLFRKGETEVI